MRIPLTVTLLLLWPTLSPAQTRFRFPANDPGGTLFNVQPMIHVDHDPVDSDVDVDCVNYAGVGFPWCYDQHTGTDFLLAHGFGTMDQYDVEVVAAADGEVIEAVDGNYDRCHGQGLDVSCDGHPIVANRVELRHADGIVSRYYHLKQGSVQVKVGQQVKCGDVLGYVGSSGISALPHLHFGVEDPQGNTLDPFAGPKSQPQSYWTEQNGPLGRPGDRCAGDPLPPDAGAPDAGQPDSAPPSLDAGPAPDAAPPPALIQPTGCGMGGGAPPALPWTLVLLLLIGALHRLASRG